MKLCGKAASEDLHLPPRGELGLLPKHLQAQLGVLGTWKSFTSATMNYGKGRVTVGRTRLASEGDPLATLKTHPKAAYLLALESPRPTSLWVHIAMQGGAVFPGSSAALPRGMEL